MLKTVPKPSISPSRMDLLSFASLSGPRVLGSATIGCGEGERCGENSAEDGVDRAEVSSEPGKGEHAEPFELGHGLYLP